MVARSLGITAEIEEWVKPELEEWLKNKNNKKKPIVIHPAIELQKILKEKFPSLSLRLCEDFIKNLKKSLGREIAIEDIKLVAESYIEQEESSIKKKRKKVKKIDKYQEKLLPLMNKQREREKLIKGIPLLIKEYSFKFNFLKIGVEKVEEKGEEAIKYLKEQMLQHINNTVYQNPNDRIRDEQLAYSIYDLKNLIKEMNYYKNKLFGAQNWLERLKEEYISAELEIRQLKKKN